MGSFLCYMGNNLTLESRVCCSISLNEAASGCLAGRTQNELHCGVRWQLSPDFLTVDEVAHP